MTDTRFPSYIHVGPSLPDTVKLMRRMVGTVGEGLEEIIDMAKWSAQDGRTYQAERTGDSTFDLLEVVMGHSPKYVTTITVSELFGIIHSGI